MTGDDFITLCTSRRKCVAFKTNDKSVDLLAWGSHCVYDFKKYAWCKFTVNGQSSKEVGVYLLSGLWSFPCRHSVNPWKQKRCSLGICISPFSDLPLNCPPYNETYSSFQIPSPGSLCPLLPLP